MTTTSTTTRTRVAIVGAGFGGLAMAIELQRAGIDDYVVLERADHVGGVWQANSYPGAACDVPSVIYQFSYALKVDWSRRFGSQAEIRQYLHDVADEQGVLPHVRYGREVTEATFDEGAGRWRVSTTTGEVYDAQVLLCATGQLSRPRILDLPGREAFEQAGGIDFHSAEWDHDVDLTGKRVVVVGGGASAIQVVPAIADRTRHLTVVQRSPSWVVGKYDWAPSGLEKALLRRFPSLHRRYRDAMWWWFESRFPLTKRRMDPLRKGWEAFLRWKIKRTVGPEKAAAATPDYPLGCNRILLSSQWFRTLARPDVDVRRTAVTALRAGGVTLADGTEVDADVVVWCTGFTATEYLAPIRIVGRDGVEIRDAWRDGPEAYLGLATPGFPNLFMSYGPNTGSLTNTIVWLLERQAAYARQAVEHVGRTGGWVDVRRGVHDAFNDELQQRLQGTVFTRPCPGWYTTEAGKVTQVWVGSHVEYGRRTRVFDPGIYEHGGGAFARDPATAGAGTTSAAPHASAEASA
jgi:cation diffusion facilitator CzcD-associated flavoprotein CzcO